MGLFGKKKSVAPPESEQQITLENGDSVSLSSVVDCIGDSCPRPQLMTKAALGKAGSGAVIGVKVDNSTSMEALPAIITENGGAHLGTIRQDRFWHVVAKKV